MFREIAIQEIWFAQLFFLLIQAEWYNMAHQIFFNIRSGYDTNPLHGPLLKNIK